VVLREPLLYWIVVPRATIFRNRTTQALGALACMILSFLTLPAQTAGTSEPPPETPFWFSLLEPQGNRIRAGLLAVSALRTLQILTGGYLNGLPFITETRYRFLR